ncbi:hypothetical protein C5U48_05380 [Mycolicibacter virginiensis]|uniref:Uncharacterized protein n=1 Tax=Mycolicibacter virginiensis TaxID=1795032 RepID=A0A9X7IPX5_9MYCO|nr:hypothetical protein [Mycolicibacter virginiensis]PQM53307.1 hypothetical protein C5U48_05380 [Mycolicibacter virginiensis]
MTDLDEPARPVWMLATQDIAVPAITGDAAMTSERLAELRTVLAALADAPVATLEAHPVPAKLDRRQGMRLDAASPLATHLSQLISQTSKAVPSAATGETLYRMVVPAKVAAQVGGGMVKSMASKTVPGGIRSALLGPSGIAAHATFVPVAGKAAASGAAGGAAAGAGVVAAGAGALTIAAPLVLMTVAVGVSAHAEQKRQQAIENIATMLMKLHDDALDRERVALSGCRAAIDKATAILLDEGQIGVGLGLDSAVYAIETAVAQAHQRLERWQRALDGLGDRPVELAQLAKHFDGIDQHQGGDFRAHLELAELAISLKKRVIVLQAVEHAQLNPANLFENFIGALKRDQKSALDLETNITDVLRRLSSLQLDRPHGVRDIVFSRGEVDDLLRAAYRLRELGDGIDTAERTSDVAIEMVRAGDGSVVVLPAHRVLAA